MSHKITPAKFRHGFSIFLIIVLVQAVFFTGLAFANKIWQCSMIYICLAYISFFNKRGFLASIFLSCIVLLSLSFFSSIYIKQQHIVSVVVSATSLLFCYCLNAFMHRMKIGGAKQASVFTSSALDAIVMSLFYCSNIGHFFCVSIQELCFRAVFCVIVATLMSFVSSLRGTKQIFV